jgi:hypothetical protein
MTTRILDDLTEEEIGRLRLLNQKLAEAEQWIRQRRDRCLRDYFKAGGVKQHDYSDELREDVEIEVEVDCVLHEDHPDFDEHDDNIVASLRWFSHDGIVDDPITHNWNEFSLWEGHRLQADRHCWLFHDLYDHVLRHDWEKILSVGGVWIDVKLVQQREIYWR